MQYSVHSENTKVRKKKRLGNNHPPTPKYHKHTGKDIFIPFTIWELKWITKIGPCIDNL